MMGNTQQVDVRLIAFYLPQFHPIPENDEWWGKGFTEWANVARAKSYFDGHEQPRLPSELGFYDLRLPEVREQQADLARAHGVHGFCYYDYWFAGRRLLERPMVEMLASGRPDFPFCVCWANENWTRRWDGFDKHILAEHIHTPETDRAYMQHLLPIIRDPRYIRIDGAPLVLVYKPGGLPDAAVTVAAWREIAREAGIPKIFLCAVQSFGFLDPRPDGFDAAVEFPPHHLAPPQAAGHLPGMDPDFKGSVFDYRQVAHLLINRSFDDYLTFRTVFPGWDNTPRRGAVGGAVFAHASPAEYEAWLYAMVMQARARQNPEHRVVFVNAWNEWAEGAYLEPDRRHGRAHLEATHRALTDRTSWHTALAALRAAPAARDPSVARALDSLEMHLRSQTRALTFFKESMSSHVEPLLHHPLPSPEERAALEAQERMRDELDRSMIQQLADADARLVAVLNSRTWRLSAPLRKLIVRLLRGRPIPPNPSG